MGLRGNDNSGLENVTTSLGADMVRRVKAIDLNVANDGGTGNDEGGVGSSAREEPLNSSVSLRWRYATSFSFNRLGCFRWESPCANDLGSS